MVYCRVLERHDFGAGEIWIRCRFAFLEMSVLISEGKPVHSTR